MCIQEYLRYLLGVARLRLLPKFAASNWSSEQNEAPLSRSGQREFDKDVATRTLHDPMTQIISLSIPDLQQMFAQGTPAPLNIVDLYVERTTPHTALRKANKELGLALDESEIEYLVSACAKDGGLARSPTNVELMVFAQINSEHCRHKHFNALVPTAIMQQSLNPWEKRERSLRLIRIRETGDRSARSYIIWYKFVNDIA